jgi:molybdate transport system substrate-binding protein
MLAAHVPLPLLFAVAFLSPLPSFGRLNVITSVGFAAAYNELVPDFQKSSGITISTKHFASQGNGPDTIAAQLRAGAAADVVIMSKEGLGELLAEGRIIPASAVDLAQVRLGVAVRAGTPKPDISTVEAFRHMLLRSKSINALSTTGLYLTEKLLPKLGIAGEVTGKIKGGGSLAPLASGEVEIAIRPVSELVNVPGIDFVGPVPEELQYLSIFSAAVVAGSKQVDAGHRLIHFLGSEEAEATIRTSGMDPVRPR